MNIEGVAKMLLWQRMLWAKTHLNPIVPQYRIVYEDEGEILKIVVPDPHWLACALHGGILPPADAYSRLSMDDQGRLVNGHLLHCAPIGPMTEEEAMEYLVIKDVPRHVWDSNGIRLNRRKFIICSVKQLPEKRILRSAWRLAAA